MPSILSSSPIPASEKLTVGVIGVNGMGFSNLKTFLKFPEVECAALCDVDSKVLEKRARETEEISGKKPALYKDFRKLLEQKDIDVVIIGTPDHWHAIQMIGACEAGKDVYCEKPLGNSIGECNRMVEAAKRYNKVVQVGQWQRSDPHWQDAVDFLRKGDLGRIRNVKVWANIGWKGSIPVIPDSPAPDGVDYNMWLGPAPERPFNRNRFHFTFRWFWEYAGGLMTDWGVHLLDFALYGMDRYVPDSVMAVGGKYAFPDDAMVTPDTMTAIYDFGDFSISWEHTVGIYGANYGRGHGLAFIGEHGTLVVDRSGWEVIPESEGYGVKEGLEAFSFERSGNNGRYHHVANFLECMKTREKPNCDIETAAYIAKFAHLGNIAYRTKDKVFWDDSEQKFIDNKDADLFIYPQYRKPWKLPVI